MNVVDDFSPADEPSTGAGWVRLAFDGLTVATVPSLADPDPNPNPPVVVPPEELVVASVWVSVNDGEWHRLQTDPLAVAAGETITVSWEGDGRITLRAGDRSASSRYCPDLDPNYDPDYDVTGPLDHLDRQLAADRQRAAADRAERQTREWYDRVPRPSPQRPDPTAILDE